MEPQWHVKASKVQARKTHRIVTVLYPFRSGKEEELQVTVEDEIMICFGGKHIVVYKESYSYYIGQK